MGIPRGIFMERKEVLSCRLIFVIDLHALVPVTITQFRHFRIRFPHYYNLLDKENRRQITSYDDLLPCLLINPQHKLISTLLPLDSLHSLGQRGCLLHTDLFIYF